MFSNQKRLNIAFILDTNSINWYLYDLIKWCKYSENFNIVCIFKNSSQDKTKKPKNLINKIFFHIIEKGIFGIVDMFFWKYLNIFEVKEITKQTDRYQKHFENYKFQIFDLKTIFLKPDLFPENKKNKFIYRYQYEEIKIIKNLNLDLIVNGSEKVLKGEILNSTRMGIISIHHGDNRFYRGGPGGFWEVFHSEKKSGYIIQILNENLDAGLVIYRSNFDTKRSFIENQMNIAEEGNIGYKKILEYISIKNKIPNVEKNILYSKKIYRMPKFWHLIIYIVKKYCKIS